MNRDAGAEEAEAFVRRLCADHGDAVFGWAVGRFEDRRDAEEVVAETMVRAWRNHHQYDSSRGSERSWVFGIARTTAADQHRRSSPRLRVVPDSEAFREAVDDLSIGRIAETTLVREALQGLSEAHRESIVLAHYGGLTVSEIAEQLAIPEGTVKSRLYYGMRALRAALEEQGVLR
ncbi:MAG TPA: sigma-70 family RNA polymerase sigma factor [Acidimicrobiia bacterium]|nr:sigma-70 family RNA polymerase sigma factor [Acidimicrobiia bacterium]